MNRIAPKIICFLIAYRILQEILARTKFAYDVASKQISMTDHQGTTSYTYDDLNRFISLDGPDSRDTISYAYDQVGNRISMTNQDGGITAYEYDALNRLISLTDPSDKATRYEYDEVSNLTQMAYPNDTQTIYKYDTLNRLLKLTNQGPEETISSYAYEYDPAGMRTNVTLENGDYINYDYDEINRLTSEVKKKWNHHKVYYSYAYKFDPVGNRMSLIRDLHQKPVFAEGELKLSKQEKGKDKGKSEDKIKPSFWDLPGSSNFSYTYDEENRLIQVRDVREDTTYIADYQYDNNGNLIEKKEYKQDEPAKAEITQYTYDFENRLTRISYPDGTTSEYKYDGVGKRIQADENGEITKYLYDGLSIIIERDGLDNTSATYTRGLSYGGGIGGIVSIERTQKIRYYLYDGLGTVIGLTDPQGTLIQSYQYDSYGNLLSSTGSEMNPYQFSTKEFSAKSGLSYFGARYYDSRVGRWITKDPLGTVDGVNFYTYVANAPTIWIDAWGSVKKKAEREVIKRVMLVTAYWDVGPGSDWKYYKPRKAGEEPGSVGPGTVAVADIKWKVIKGKAVRVERGPAKPSYPYGTIVKVYNDKGEVIYRGEVHDTGRGHTLYRKKFPDYYGKADSWIDIWLPEEEGQKWGAQEQTVELQLPPKD